MANQQQIMEFVIKLYPDHLEDRDNVRIFGFYNKIYTYTYKLLIFYNECKYHMLALCLILSGGKNTITLCSSFARNNFGSESIVFAFNWTRSRWKCCRCGKNSSKKLINLSRKKLCTTSTVRNMAWIENSYVNVQIVLDFADGIFFFNLKNCKSKAIIRKTMRKTFENVNFAF